MSAVKGVRVEVPFGNQTKIGVVVDFPKTSDVSEDKIKPIKAVLDLEPIFDEEIWVLLSWAARYYHAPIGEVVINALPVKLRNGDSTERSQPDYFAVTEAGRAALLSGENKRAKKQQDLLAELAEIANFFEKPTACSQSAWKGLLEKNYIEPVNVPFEPQHWQKNCKIDRL
ncbi:primosome assembly protein PriA [Actinobacillus equuli]|nr:primosome assembly protein PriA [Actinobacillus equuli]